ncbi:MAG: pilus assembly protein CpaF [Candidatus Omnitrophica bacterium CG1_02_46_14]|nr:MAG: pilus assembly protein CpaF [Candidatus Omnitrophica bacterium CG1_02_46_14]
MKSKLHQEVINKIDVDLLVKFDSETARREVSKIILDLVNESDFPLNIPEKKQITEEVVDETFGLGPLEPLLQDKTIDDILVNNYNTVFIERRGKLETTNVRFKDNTHLRHIINRIVARVGRRIDEASPMVDARLPDGSRVNAIIPPLALDGPSLCIRRFKEVPLRGEDLIEYGSMSKEILFLMQVAVKSRLNILIAGGTGSGKTTLLNILSGYIPDNERIITVEDAAELQLQQSHVIRLETRPANMEGKGLVTQRDLVKNCLRMRPDRIILGEVRGVEALDMLQAMNTGHDGSITTVHSNSARDALSRLETMILMTNANMSPLAINRQIASALQLIIYARRFSDGVRRVESISEITGMEGNTITMQEIVSFVQKGVSENGECLGGFELRAVKPKFLDKARLLGIAGIANPA